MGVVTHVFVDMWQPRGYPLVLPTLDGTHVHSPREIIDEGKGVHT